MAKKYTEDEIKCRLSLTDYIQELYINQGYKKEEINWKLITVQIRTILEENQCRHSTIEFTLRYMVEIREIDIFSNKSNGSVLDLMPYYLIEAKEFYERKMGITEEIGNFYADEEVKTIKANKNKKKRYKIDTKF